MISVALAQSGRVLLQREALTIADPLSGLLGTTAKLLHNSLQQDMCHRMSYNKGWAHYAVPASGHGMGPWR